MAERIYEHHFYIRKDKLCPFKLNFVENAYGCACNWHRNIEIIFIVDGNGIIRYGSEVFDIGKGDFIVVNSDTLHCLDSKNGIKYYYLIVDETFCAENGINTESCSFTPVFRSDVTDGIFREAASRIMEYLSSKDTSLSIKIAKARQAVLALLIDICENHSENKTTRERISKSTEEYVKKVISYMSDKYNEALSLDGLAEICGITKPYLSREFKNYTGQTVMTYLNIIRCKNAEMLLADGRSVTEAAYECGFESVSYFSRTYKKLMGDLPSRIAVKR